MPKPKNDLRNLYADLNLESRVLLAAPTDAQGGDQSSGAANSGESSQPTSSSPSSSGTTESAPSSSAPSSSGPSSSGPSSNGPSSNGPSSNGPSSNGPSSNGPSSNDKAPEKTTASDPSSKGTSNQDPQAATPSAGNTPGRATENDGVGSQNSAPSDDSGANGQPDKAAHDAAAPTGSETPGVTNSQGTDAEVDEFSGTNSGESADIEGATAAEAGEAAGENWDGVNHSEDLGADAVGDEFDAAGAGFDEAGAGFEAASDSFSDSASGEFANVEGATAAEAGENWDGANHSEDLGADSIGGEFDAGFDAVGAGFDAAGAGFDAAAAGFDAATDGEFDAEFEAATAEFDAIGAEFDAAGAGFDAASDSFSDTASGEFANVEGATAAEAGENWNGVDGIENLAGEFAAAGFDAADAGFDAAGAGLDAAGAGFDAALTEFNAATGGEFSAEFDAAGASFDAAGAGFDAAGAGFDAALGGDFEAAAAGFDAAGVGFDVAGDGFDSTAAGFEAATGGEFANALGGEFDAASAGFDFAGAGFDAAAASFEAAARGDFEAALAGFDAAGAGFDAAGAGFDAVGAGFETARDAFTNTASGEFANIEGATAAEVGGLGEFAGENWEGANHSEGLATDTAGATPEAAEAKKGNENWLTSGMHDGINIQSEPGISSAIKVPNVLLRDRGFTQEQIDQLSPVEKATELGKFLNEEGIGTVRIGIDRAEAVDKSGDFQTAIDQIDALGQQGVKSLVNMWTDGSPNNFQDGDAQAWQNIVEATRDNANVVGYELLNEPDYTGRAGVNEYVQEVSDVYNSVDNWGDKAIVVDGLGFATRFPDDLVSGVQETIPNAVWGVHAYPYTHGGGPRDSSKGFTDEQNARTEEDWKNHYLESYRRNYDGFEGNYALTEFGAPDKVSQEITPDTPQNEATAIRRARGYVAAVDEYFSGTSAFFFDLGPSANDYIRPSGKVNTQNNQAIRDIWS